MKIDLSQIRLKFQWIFRVINKFWHMIKRLLREQFNKNIYTKILFTNVISFVAILIILTISSSFVVKSVIYDQVQQDLIRKAKRVNFALLQQNDDQAWKAAPNKETNNQEQRTEDLLKFLADTFDTKITLFDKKGNIMSTSAKQEVVPGSKVEEKFIKILTKGETEITQTIDQDTGQTIFIATIPMGNNKDTIKNGILLETNPSNLDLALNKIRLYLVVSGMVILVFIIFISVYLAMHISRPITRLTSTVAEFSRGNYILNTGNQPLDEINNLVDELNKLSAKLQKIQIESRKMEEEKTHLFAEISHELRTPLTAVQGFVEAIRDGMVQDEVLLNKYLDTIYTQTVHISRLVDDLLELNRLESGNITVEKLSVDLIALTQGVVISMESIANSNNTSILIDKKTENALVLGDVDRMEQILRNLLKNAIKATENGTIKVGIEAQQDEVILTIKDNGIGIPPEDLPHIWDRFYRVKNQRNEHHIWEKGSGLGLVIVKKLVQLQDGQIDITSQLGKGTTFRIIFPSYNQK